MPNTPRTFHSLLRAHLQRKFIRHHPPHLQYPKEKRCVFACWRYRSVVVVVPPQLLFSSVANSTQHSTVSTCSHPIKINPLIFVHTSQHLFQKCQCLFSELYINITTCRIYIYNVFVCECWCTSLSTVGFTIENTQYCLTHCFHMLARPSRSTS